MQHTQGPTTRTHHTPQTIEYKAYKNTNTSRHFLNQRTSAPCLSSGSVTQCNAAQSTAEDAVIPHVRRITGPKTSRQWRGKDRATPVGVPYLCAVPQIYTAAVILQEK